MGILSSKVTRRVSFDNNLAISPALNIQKSLEESDNITDLVDLANGQDDDLIFHDNKIVEPQQQEEGDGDYWAHRIEYLKKEHQTINKILESEYEKTVEEKLNGAFEYPKVTNEKLQKIKPCIDGRTKILQCYEDNPHQTLVCATLVQAFVECVSSCRMEE